MVVMFLPSVAVTVITGLAGPAISGTEPVVDLLLPSQKKTPGGRREQHAIRIPIIGHKQRIGNVT